MAQRRGGLDLQKIWLREWRAQPAQPRNSSFQSFIYRIHLFTHVFSLSLLDSFIDSSIK